MEKTLTDSAESVLRYFLTKRARYGSLVPERVDAALTEADRAELQKRLATTTGDADCEPALLFGPYIVVRSASSGKYYFIIQGAVFGLGKTLEGATLFFTGDRSWSDATMCGRLE